jgi:radical SAM protein with 4Fe4S-binding SPASM domain
MQRLDHLIWSCTRTYDTKCAYYLGDGKPHSDELNTQEAKMLLDKVSQFGVDNLFITGAGFTGEPLIRRDFFEILEYCHELGLTPYVKITGDIFSPKIAKELASVVSMVIITMGGPKDVDFLLRGEGAYDRSVLAAKICSKEGIPFALSFVNTKYLVDRIRDIVVFSKDLGAKSFHFASLIPQPICRDEQKRILGPLEPSPAERERELNQIYQLSKEFANELAIVPYDMFYNRILKTREPNLNLSSTCSACNNLENYEWLEILDDGKIYGCCPLDLCFGNIKDDSLDEVWVRLRNSVFLKKLADRKNLKGKCGFCEYKNVCGGCRARALFVTGDAFNADPACSYIPTNLRIKVR